MATPTFQQEVERRIQELVPAGQRSAWSVSSALPSRAYVDVSVVYRVAFDSSTSRLRPGPLPAGTDEVDGPATLRSVLAVQRETKQAELSDRVERWLREAAADCEAVLTAADCLGEVRVAGYRVRCDHCAGSGRLRGDARGLVECQPCAATGVRHVLGTLLCHVGRAFTMKLRDAPSDAPAWLRETTTLTPLRAIGDFVRGPWSLLPGQLRLSYDGVIELCRCDVLVREEKLAVWSFGQDGRVQDFSQVAQKLVEPASDDLRAALAHERDTRACAAASQAFFAAPLHKLAAREQPAASEPLAAALRDRLVTAAYLEQAHALAKRARGAMAHAVGRGVSPWLGLPVVVALGLHAFAVRRALAALGAALLVGLTYKLTEWLMARGVRKAWGTELPASWGRKRARAREWAWLSLALAVGLAGLPSTLPLRLFDRLGAPDRISGIYQHGEQRLLVLPDGSSTLVLRHLTEDCDELALVKLGISGNYVRIGGASAGSAFLRSEGPSFVVLPDADHGCGERLAPQRFTRSKLPLTCRTVQDGARLTRLGRAATSKLAHGQQVRVLPWLPDLRQVLVQTVANDVGTMRARDLDCTPRALAALRDALFGPYTVDDVTAGR